MAQPETNIQSISYSEIESFWKKNLWPERTESLRPMSSMMLQGGFDPEIRKRFSPIFLGLFCDKNLVGVVSGHFSSSFDFRVRGLSVEEKYRKRSFGSKLLHAIIEYARKANAATVWSYPRVPAWSVYAKSGFQRTERKLRETDNNFYAYINFQKVEGTIRGENQTDIGYVKENLRRLDAVSSTLCLAKWNQLSLHLHSGLSHSCHHPTPHHINKESLLNPGNMHNTPETVLARAEMLNGKKPMECKYCWEVEALGELSDRAYKSAASWARDRLSKIEKGESLEVLPTYLEVGFDSECQFKCMYCNPSTSSRWAREIERFGPYQLSKPFHQWVAPEQHSRNTNPYIEAFWRWWPELVPQLRTLRITGGEPFLSPETFKVIDNLIANPRPKLKFAINTNMGFQGAQLDIFLKKIRHLQQSVGEVQIFTSIDSIGKQAEYIRYGLDYSLFLQNICTVLDKADNGLRLGFMITFNILSPPGIRALMEEILRFRQRYPQHKIDFVTPHLTEPKHFSVRLLPLNFSSYIESALNFMEENLQTESKAGFTHTEWQRLGRVLKVFNSARIANPELQILKHDFRTMLTEYDRRRSTNFLATFPEYRTFWDDCSL